MQPPRRQERQDGRQAIHLKLFSLPTWRFLASWRLGLLCVVVPLCFASLARADFVEKFDVTMRVMPDASLDVTESIEMFFDTPRHGIYRHIPVKYERHGDTFSVEFRLDSITDENGSNVPYSTARQGRDVSMKIGDKDVTLTGSHTYKLHYVVRRAVNFFGGENGGAPEVYWNATGDQWPYPIKNATVTLIPPEGVAIKDIRTTSFSGARGSTGAGPIDVKSDSIVYSSGGALSPGSGLTIVAGLPAGSIIKPSIGQEIWWFILDWWPVAILPMLAGAIVWIAWRRNGRDEGAGTQAVAVEFTPPKDLSPAEVGTLIDESADTPDVIATLIDLAARGWIRITELPANKILFLSSRDYEFARLVPPKDDALKPHEGAFLDGLFSDSHPQLTRLSDQKEKFYKHIDPIKKSIYRELTAARLFKRNPEAVRAAWIAWGVIVAVIGVVLFFVIDRHRSFGVGTAIAGIIFVCAASAMPARTLIGTRKLIEILSFKRFVTMVEKDRIKQMAMDDPTIFGRLLPYAMVLGVADQWAEAFKGLSMPAPDWYRSYDNRPFDTYFFVNSLGSGMRTMQKTMTSAPQAASSSAGSGGSGFSGGFSGGGFGGGGGGSW